MAPPIDSRLGPGTLTLGAVEYGAQIANIMLEPSTDEEDGTPTLHEPDPLPEVSESWTLSGEAIQDFEEAAGFVNYCMDNALTVVPFVWTPNTDAETSFAGDVLITSVPIGGDVSTQNRSSFEWPVQGAPTRTDPAAAPALRSRDAAAARARRRSSLAAAAKPADSKTAKAKG